MGRQDQPAARALEWPEPQNGWSLVSTPGTLARPTPASSEPPGREGGVHVLRWSGSGLQYRSVSAKVTVGIMLTLGDDTDPPLCLAL